MELKMQWHEINGLCNIHYRFEDGRQNRKKKKWNLE